MAKKSNVFRKLRKALGLRQDQFWPRIGVSQSGGSRYENEREAPEPVRLLVDLVFALPAKKAHSQLSRIRGS